MFLLFTVAIVILLVLAAYSAGASHALRVGFLCSLFVPTWMGARFGAMTIDLRMMAVLVLFPVAIWGGRWIRGLNLLDGLVMLLTWIGIASLIRTDLASPSEIGLVVSSWVVPYLFGRLLVHSMSDLHRLVPWACSACIALSTWSIFESTTKINPVNELAQRSGSHNSENDNRMSLRRAEGPQGHPIYFGMTMAIMFPWTLEGFRLAHSRRISVLFKIAPLLCVLGVMGTVSRGPLLVMLFAATFAAFIYFPLVRLPLFFSVMVTGVLAFAAWPVVVEYLERVSGEDTEYTVMIEGSEYFYTGTKHRQLLYLVYDEAIANAGWMGHGKWGAKPSHQVYLEPQLRNQFESIDNHYILLTLNWGIAGLIAFLILGGTALISGLWLALTTPRDYQLLLAGIVGSLGAVMIFLLTVWMCSDFAYFWLLSLGVLSSTSLVWKEQRARQHESYFATPQALAANANAQPSFNPQIDLPNESSDPLSPGLQSHASSLISPLSPATELCFNSERPPFYAN